MNNEIARDPSRATLPPRLGAVHWRTAKEPLPAAAMIPTLELRRLVAAMVD
ncbi:hypothetical protein [Novosphingobium sp. PC22D]|uniref:hypothetical protein n=1 Tax=Novosphingobium sp. PC22D TaxID=1962403 RepID=UPI00143AF298|nr:hypothetical protein [Novosphingobium sp. PC22D]